MISTPIENKEDIQYKPFSNVNLTRQTINFFNNKLDSYSANSQGLEGGINQKWNIAKIEDVSKNSVECSCPDGMTMEDYLDVILQKINRTDFPIILDPKTASFNDVAIHGILRQRKGKSTVAKHIRYAKFMENHKVPVNFRNPTFENFIRHVDYREQFEFEDGKGYSALTHE